MNQINKKPISELGYGFIPPQYIPKGKDEYYLRNLQNRNGTRYRKLSSIEIKTLERNANSSDNWNKVLVADDFNPELVKNCRFYGLVRLGKLEPLFHEFNNLRMPVGLYNSTIISCDIGDNAVIDNVNFMSHYITGENVILVNINELATTDHSKFGNGVVKKGEKESVRIWLEICNENAGRAVLPFNGMQAADAWLWSKYRDDEKLQQRFKEFTDKKYDTRRGYYGKIGDRTVIKNCGIIKDVWIGTDAYIKGANKLKNLTINSGPQAKSQVGEGCELVNGIMGSGCRVFYGVKAVRFVMGPNSQLKYGARLINSYLGDNSTISCCEVLNSLIFPAHEQHHNNSFLCAATVYGQSNMAAGATIGSNHNSRGADGEMLAGRGFWPGLCVSLKHNSRFASFTLIAKADYPAELDIPIPFSLVNNDAANDRLQVLPGYWFMYNMYALARNVTKYISRDKRTERMLEIEYDFLAPDTVNELFTALGLLKKYTAMAWAKKNKKTIAANHLASTGEKLLETKSAELAQLDILADGFENSGRPVQLLKVPEAYRLFKELIAFYGVSQLMQGIEKKNISSWSRLQQMIKTGKQRNNWRNIGGQLMTEAALHSLIRNIRSGKAGSWDEVHTFYEQKGASYPADKLQHAIASLLEVKKISPSKFNKRIFQHWLQEAVDTRRWMTKGIHDSRAKDFSSPFRKMLYDTEKEMDKVLGKFSENSFIRQQQEESNDFEKRAEAVYQRFV